MTLTKLKIKVGQWLQSALQVSLIFTGQTSAFKDILSILILTKVDVKMDELKPYYVRYCFIQYNVLFFLIEQEPRVRIKFF